MDRSDVIELLTETKEQDENGVWRTTISARQVFCSVSSVSRSEFFEGGRNGLNPQFVFRVFFGDYKDERSLRYNGKAYGIYRTYYAKNDIVELYAERKGGTNGHEEDHD